MLELDVHVLTASDTPCDWQNQCLVSIRNAVKYATFPVHIHVVDAIPGNQGAARAAGYAAGTAPWKTYVDDDDIVLPDAFEILGRHLEVTDAAAVMPREYAMQNGQIITRMHRRHHLNCYRADVVQAFDFGAWKAMADLALQLSTMRDPRGVLDIDDAIYIHRLYANSGGRRLRARHPAERERIVAMFGPSEGTNNG